MEGDCGLNCVHQFIRSGLPQDIRQCRLPELLLSLLQEGLCGMVYIVELVRVQVAYSNQRRDVVDYCIKEGLPALCPLLCLPLFGDITKSTVVSKKDGLVFF